MNRGDVDLLTAAFSTLGLQVSVWGPGWSDGLNASPSLVRVSRDERDEQWHAIVDQSPNGTFHISLTDEEVTVRDKVTASTTEHVIEVVLRHIVSLGVRHDPRKR